MILVIAYTRPRTGERVTIEQAVRVDREEGILLSGQNPRERAEPRPCPWPATRI